MWVARINATLAEWSVDLANLNRASLVLFWTDVRNHLEAQNYGRRYSYIRFFANFILHTNLSRRANFQPLADFAKFIDAFEFENGEDLRRRLAQLVGVDRLTAELNSLEAECGLNFHALRRPGAYTKFLNLLFGELVGKSIDGAQHLYRDGQLNRQRAEALFGADYQWGVTKVEFAPMLNREAFQLRVFLITSWHSDENGPGRIGILFPPFELRT